MTDIIPYNMGFDITILAGSVGQSSMVMYQRDFKVYLEFAKTPDTALNPQTLARWRVHLATNTKHSPNTINRMLSSVRTIIRSAEEQGYVPNGTWQGFQQIRGIKTEALKQRTKPNARTRIEPEDMRRLVDAPDTNTLIGIRDRAMLHTLASSGVRIHELSTLTPEQIATKKEGYQLRVIGKNDTEYRDAPLSREAYDHVMEWLQKRHVPSPYIFTSFANRSQKLTDRAMTEMSIWRTVKHYAGLCGLRNIKPHDFRRFVGTQVAQTDLRQAQKALGHKKLDTTARHYILDDLKIGITDNLF